MRHVQTKQHLEEDHPEIPYIGLSRPLSVLPKLRRDPECGPRGCESSFALIEVLQIVQALLKRCICQLNGDAPIRRLHEQNVVREDSLVDDTVPMEEIERF